MKYVFINYPKCSTCQKAKKFLDLREELKGIEIVDCLLVNFLIAVECYIEV